MDRNIIIETAKGVKDGLKLTMTTSREVKVKKGYPYSPIIKEVTYSWVYNSESYFHKIMEKFGTHQEAVREPFYEKIEGILYKSIKNPENLYVNFSYLPEDLKTTVVYYRDGKEIDPFTVQDETTSFLYADEWPNKKGETLQRTSSGLAPAPEKRVRYQANKLDNIIELGVIEE